MRLNSTFLGVLLFSLLGSLNLIAQTPVIPFGSNNSYSYGTMQTYQTNTQGDALAQSWYTYWKTNFTRDCGGGKYLAINDYNSQNAYSEGQGYGLLLAAYMGDKTLFDQLWKGYKDHRNGNGVMHWTVNCSGTVSANGATDGDLDAAMALLIANKQWPGTTSPYNYSSDATALINAIKTHEFTTCNGKTVQKPGDMFGGCDCTNPSYFATGYYRAFGKHVTADAAFWEKAANDGLALLLTATNSTTGLNPAWTDQTGSITTGGNCNVAASGGGTKTDYQFDAARTPWRIVVDYLWWGTPAAKQYLDKVCGWVNSPKGISNIVAGMKTDGTNNVSYKNSAFTGAFAIGAMATGNQTMINNFYQYWTTNSATSGGVLDDQPYFQNSLRTMYSLVSSGNFWNPYANSTPPTGVTVNLTAPATGTNISEGSNLTLTATATTTSGTITKVEYFRGTTKIGESTTGPTYSFTWTNVPAGTYSITAVATNSSSETATSSIATLNVNKAIFQTGTAPTIDGTIDAVWSSYTATALGNTNQPTISSAADLTASWRALWDATNLYLLVEVTDDVKRNDAGTDTYNDDELEIYIDIGNNKPSTYGTNDHQYTFRWNDATLVRETHGHSTTGITRATSNPTTTTYIHEIRIPWSTMGGTPTIDQLVGFDVMLNDDDDGGARDGKKAWAATGDDTWSNPSLMGTVVLKGTTCTTPAATITATGSTTFCSGGSVTLNANTGTGLTYVWNRNASPIAGATSSSYSANQAGSYTVTVTSNGCSATSSATSVTVNTAPAATITAAGSTTFCSGGSVTLNANTGTGLTYVWNRNASPIAGATSSSYSANQAGSYTVTVTSNGCSATSSATSVTVSTPATIANAGQDQSICNTNSTLAGNTPTTGTGIWSVISGTGTFVNSSSSSSGVSNLSNGTNTFRWTITNGACTSSDDISITVSGAPTAANAGPDQYITITSATLAANTPSLGSGTWSTTGSSSFANTSNPATTVSGLSTGANTFTWTITNGACTSSDNVIIHVGSVPTTSAVSGDQNVSPNETGVTYSVTNNPGSTYTWTVPAGATIVSGQGTNTIIVNFGTSGGAVSVTESNNFGTGSPVNTNVTMITTNTLARNFIGTIDLYPNPFADETRIKINSEVTHPITLKIVDVNGKELKAIEDNYTNETILVGQDLKEGVYFVQITHGNKLQVVKVVKFK